MIELSIIIKKFENEFSSLKKTQYNSCFDYNSNNILFSSVAKSHFNKENITDRYGIYVIRKKTTKEVLYIGKSGTITNNGKYKGQDILGRLTNIRGKTPSNIWFSYLIDKYGAISVDYCYLPVSKSPTLMESLLLQSYLNEFGCLPPENKTF